MPLRPRALLALLVLAVPGLAAPGLVQGQGATNDLPLNNDFDAVFLLSDPSVGAPAGTYPPDWLGGDQFWTVVPREVLRCDSGTIRVTGMWEEYWDTDGSTDGWFYDRVLGNAYELADVGGTPGCARVPSWVALGAPDGSEVHVSLGPAGIPTPCGFATTCTPAPCGVADNGYYVSWSSFTIDVACDGAQDLALTYFLPGGMTTSATGPVGPNGCGDYVYQTYWSTDETQGDCCGDGVSPYSGVGVAGSFSVDPLEHAPSVHLAFADEVVNVLARTSNEDGDEPGPNAGGARNGLCLDTSSGTAAVALEVRDHTITETHPAGCNLAVAAFSLGALAAPGTTVLGGQLLIAPDALLALTIASGPVLAVTPLFTGEGIYQGPIFPVPVPGTFHAQGFVLRLCEPGAFTADATQAWTFTAM